MRERVKALRELRATAEQLTLACAAYVGSPSAQLHAAYDSVLAEPIDELDRGVLGIVSIYREAGKL